MTTSAANLRNTSTRTKVLAAIAIVAAVLYLLLDLRGGLDWLHLVLKPIPVLMLALWVSTLPLKGRYQMAIAAGLLLSALGDVLLEISDATFLFGLVAFLLGHVAYIVAFVQDCRRLCPWRAVAAYAYGALAFAFLLATGDLGAMTVPVLLYVIVITSMLWRAASRVDAPGVLAFSARAGLIGALFFVASDSILSFRMFGTPINLGGLAVMATYWLGQLGIALSAMQSAALADISAGARPA